MGRRGLGLVLALVVVALLAACKSESSTTPARRRASLQLRAVLALVPSAPGAKATVLATTGAIAALDGADRRFVYGVGPVAMTETAVSGARARNLPGQGWVIDVALNRKGARALNELAEEQYPLSPPQNMVAIVIDGTVQSAPAFQQPSFFGGQVQITPGKALSGAQAEALAASLRP